jgi:hypothetical protein
VVLTPFILLPTLPTETEEWMDQQITPNRTLLYKLEQDGKFYVAYNQTLPSLDQASAFCWTDNATVPVPYPKLAQTIVSRYANQTGRYAAGIMRSNVSGTRWITYDGKF